jgi:hypothetical protein
MTVPKEHVVDKEKVLSDLESIKMKIILLGLVMLLT